MTVDIADSIAYTNGNDNYFTIGFGGLDHWNRDLIDYFDSNCLGCFPIPGLYYITFFAECTVGDTASAYILNPKPNGNAGVLGIRNDFLDPNPYIADGTDWDTTECNTNYEPGIIRRVMTRNNDVTNSIVIPSGDPPYYQSNDADQDDYFIDLIYQFDSTQTSIRIIYAYFSSNPSEEYPGFGSSNPNHIDRGSATLYKATPFPTRSPTGPSLPPTSNPSISPTEPTANPSVAPTRNPSLDPTFNPTIEPTTDPTRSPSMEPTIDPTQEPTIPTISPSFYPTNEPTNDPTIEPTNVPTYDFGEFKQCGYDDIILSGVRIEIYRDSINQRIGITIIGPADKWFGYGFGNDVMNGMYLSMVSEICPW